MPTSILSEKELQSVLKAVITSHSVAELDGLLEACHEFKSFGRLQPSERYFHKNLRYRDFKVHVPCVVYDNNTLLKADIQFMRPSKFPAPYLNRNNKLIKELDAILSSLLGGQQDTGTRNGLSYYHYGECLEVPDEDDRETTGWECTLVDERHSSGRTDPSVTDIRNDFVMIMYESPRVEREEQEEREALQRSIDEKLNTGEDFTPEEAALIDANSGEFEALQRSQEEWEYRQELEASLSEWEHRVYIRMEEWEYRQELEARAAEGGEITSKEAEWLKALKEAERDFEERKAKGQLFYDDDDEDEPFDIDP